MTPTAEKTTRFRKFRRAKNDNGLGGKTRWSSTTTSSGEPVSVIFVVNDGERLSGPGNERFNFEIPTTASRKVLR